MLKMQHAVKLLSSLLFPNSPLGATSSTGFLSAAQSRISALKLQCFHDKALKTEYPAERTQQEGFQ